MKLKSSLDNIESYLKEYYKTSFANDIKRIKELNKAIKELDKIQRKWHKEERMGKTRK